MVRSESVLRDTALVAVFAAFIAALSLAPAIAIAGPVPITFQTLAIALTAVILGPWRGALATLLYLVVGLAGLPVFAGGAAGLGVVARPSAGYLLAFPLAALLAGLIARRVLRLQRRYWVPGLWVAGIVGLIVFDHVCGIAGMMVNADLTLRAAFAADVVFVPVDLAKTLVAGAVGAVVHRAFPALLARRGAVRVPGAGVAEPAVTE